MNASILRDAIRQLVVFEHLNCEKVIIGGKS